MLSLSTSLPARDALGAATAARDESRGPGSARLARLALLARLWSWLGGAPARGALREYDAKAAFLFNFATFGEWPADAFAALRRVQLGLSPKLLRLAQLVSLDPQSS